MVRLAVILLATTLLPACDRCREPLLIIVNSDDRNQKIEGWGTSMVFWDLPSTPYRDPAWRRAYRDLGLNILRVNINKEVLVDASGDMALPVWLGPDLEENVARMEFNNPKTRVYGEMAAWLRQNALEPNRVKITGSIWSPPHWMKGPTGTRQHHVIRPSVEKPTPWLSEGKGGDSIGGRLIQTADNRQQLARYLAAWLRGFERHYGVPIYAASIQNEVSFENPFDSMTYSKGPNGEVAQWWQYAAALEAITRELTDRGIETKIMGPHMSQVGETPSNPWGLWHQMNYIESLKNHRDRNLIQFLFAYNSNGYMGTSEEAVKMWAAYYHGKEVVPANWASWTKAPGVHSDRKPIWVSEAGGADNAWLDGEDGSPGNGAITVAQKMHNALVHGNASAYVYWQMTEHDEEAGHDTLLGKKDVHDPTRARKYSAFKQFSRYIRPGAVRIGAAFSNGWSSFGGASRYDTYHSLSVSAFLHETDRTITIVLLNMRRYGQRVSILLPEDLHIPGLRIYVTSEEEGFTRWGDLQATNGRVSLTVPAHAVLTLHGPTIADSREVSP